MDVKEAIMDRDAIDLKDSLTKLFKQQPEMTYIQLENTFREKGLKVWIIAMERNINPSMLLMDLQGNLNKQWAISYRFSPKADRPKDFDAWPKSLEENMERLADAGEPVPNHRPRCLNCKELGHIAKNCTMEKIEPADKATIRCYNCDSEGHRVRDCESHSWMDRRNSTLILDLQAPSLARTASPAATVARAATRPPSAPSLVMPTTSNATSAMRVCPHSFRRRSVLLLTILSGPLLSRLPPGRRR